MTNPMHLVAAVPFVGVFAPLAVMAMGPFGLVMVSLAGAMACPVVSKRGLKVAKAFLREALAGAKPEWGVALYDALMWGAAVVVALCAARLVREAAKAIAIGPIPGPVQPLRAGAK
jgi:hypothetical protein